ncbi:MAG: peptidoglycan-binding domain-containing protein [Pseudomonadota bacterium]
MISSSIGILGSVGRRGRNEPSDVITIQQRLNALGGDARAPLAVDGVAGHKTTEAIADFQRRVVGLGSPDARIEPDDRTIGAMNDPASAGIWRRNGVQHRAAVPAPSPGLAGTSPTGTPLPAMPHPEEREGTAAPGMNFAGKGWSGAYRTRPTCTFDFAAKLHDLYYAVNDLSFSLLKPVDPVIASKRARADMIFHIMNDHCPAQGAAAAYDWVSRSIFRPQSDIVEGDGFINVMAEPQYLMRLNRPHDYLMIPYNALPRAQRPVVERVETGNWGTQRIEEPDYLVPVAYDTAPGFIAWYDATYGPVTERIRRMEGFLL